MRTGPGPSGSAAVTRRGAASADGRAQSRLWPAAEAWPTPQGRGRGGSRSLPTRSTSTDPRRSGARGRAAPREEIYGLRKLRPEPALRRRHRRHAGRSRGPCAAAPAASVAGGRLTARGRAARPPTAVASSERGRRRHFAVPRGAGSAQHGRARLRCGRVKAAGGRRRGRAAEPGVSVRLVSPSVALDT